MPKKEIKINKITQKKIKKKLLKMTISHQNKMNTAPKMSTAAKKNNKKEIKKKEKENLKKTPLNKKEKICTNQKEKNIL
jgi:hypothetical protein